MSATPIPSPVNDQIPAPQSNKNAVASLVLGIGGWVVYLAVFCFNITFGMLLSIVTAGMGLLCLIPLGCVSPLMWLSAVITGHIGMKKAKESNGNGRGMAISGLVTGYLGLGIMIALIILVVVLFIITGSFAFLQNIVPYSTESTY